MPDKDAGTPRVYLARHGETEWTQNGRYTGATELPLTPTGAHQVLSTGKMLIGHGKLIDPSRLAHVFVSPRLRAQSTFNLLFNDNSDTSTSLVAAPAAGSKDALINAAMVSTTGELAEWDYGLYEGLVTGEIREGRKARGLDGDGEWDIWRQGCEGGESPHDISTRIDTLIRKIHGLQSPYMRGEKPADVILIAHGHILRALVKRWLGYPLEAPLSMMIEPGGIGILSYQHHNISEPAFLLGLAFPA